MTIIQMLLKEMEQEAEKTKKMLERVPEDHFSWKPHEKSMSMLRLVTHLAELPGWVSMALTTDGVDFATSSYQPTPIATRGELLHLFEESYASGKAELQKASEQQLEQPWVLKNGDQVLASMTKGETIRHAFSQTIHHRAQLGVYLRLLNIPIPGTYGPSADEQSF